MRSVAKDHPIITLRWVISLGEGEDKTLVYRVCNLIWLYYLVKADLTEKYTNWFNCHVPLTSVTIIVIAPEPWLSESVNQWVNKLTGWFCTWVMFSFWLIESSLYVRDRDRDRMQIVSSTENLVLQSDSRQIGGRWSVGGLTKRPYQ